MCLAALYPQEILSLVAPVNFRISWHKRMRHARRNRLNNQRSADYRCSGIIPMAKAVSG